MNLVDPDGKSIWIVNSNGDITAGSAERVPAVAGNRIPPWRAIGYRVRTAC